jgi:hypothetical protein
MAEKPINIPTLSLGQPVSISNVQTEQRADRTIDKYTDFGSE